MNYQTILLFLGLIMLNTHDSSIPSLARAETVIEDLGEEAAQEKDDKRYAGGKTKEERAKVVAEKKARKKKLESCLVITRSYYKLHEDRFDTYL